MGEHALNGPSWHGAFRFYKIACTIYICRVAARWREAVSVSPLLSRAAAERALLPPTHVQGMYRASFATALKQQPSGKRTDSYGCECGGSCTQPATLHALQHSQRKTASMVHLGISSDAFACTAHNQVSSEVFRLNRKYTLNVCNWV